MMEEQVQAATRAENEVEAGAVRQEAITLGSGQVMLAGSLLLPVSVPARGCPGVVLVHGSGDADREENRAIGAHFARRGIVALIYDKRGAGASTGNWRTGTFSELADDALAGVELLARRPEVDEHRIGLWGLSEGGWVAPLATARSRRVRFLVAVSAPGMSPARQERYRRRLLSDAASTSRIRRAWARLRTRGMFAIVRHAPNGWLRGRAGYFHRTLDFDPAPVWQAITQPVLLIFGIADRQVPPRESAAMIQGTLSAAGHADHTLRMFAGANHFLQCADASGLEPEFVPGYLDAMAEWILAR